MSAIRRRTKKDPGFHTVSKYLIIQRLEKIEGAFEAAILTLKTNELLYQKWLSVAEIKSNDEAARLLFQSIGIDPDVILAK